MGAYKGRVNVRHRSRRFKKSERIKALAAEKKESAVPAGKAEEKAA
jgi:hypothetical protein